MKNQFKVIILLYLSFCLILLVVNYHKIPTKTQHINRNKTNIIPVGKLMLIPNNGDEYYLDENNIKWKKRTFFRNLLHNPFTPFNISNDVFTD